VIIIEPNRQEQATLNQLFQAQPDIQTTYFQNAADARVELSRTSFNFLFISTHLGLPTATEVLSQLRGEYPAQTILVISEKLSLEQVRPLIQAGVDQLAILPMTAEHLAKKMQSAVEFRKQVQREESTAPLSSRTGFEARMEQLTEDLYRVSLTGWLSENCTLPPVPKFSKAPTLFVDCERLWGMNSVGVRTWLLWIRELFDAGIHQIEFENLRPNFLQQSRILKNLIPDSSVVNSFFLEYWNDDLDLQTEIKISRGVNYDADKMAIPKFCQRTIEDKLITFELDESPSRLLSFYKGRIEVVTEEK
jgi:DNA-binding NarL/FixJ family response regulator